MSRIPCLRCGSMILETTAKAYAGLCAPCHGGGGICEVCKDRMRAPRRDGKYICHACETAGRINSISFLPKEEWKQFSDVDWALIAENYRLLVEDQLRQFRQMQGDDPAYSVVLQLGQNWMLDVHINTQSGIGEIAANMRKTANWAQGKSDEELFRSTGIWYTPAWKYELLGCLLKSPLDGIVDFHYELFERLYDAAADQEDDEASDLVLRKVEEARLSATEAIQQSEAFAQILKTPDFKVFVVDDDGLDFHTKARIGE